MLGMLERPECVAKFVAKCVANPVANSVANLNVFIPVPETYPGGLGSVAKSVAKLTGGLCWITFYKKGVSTQDPAFSKCSKVLEGVAKCVANNVAKCVADFKV
jgi:hypothetical protein